MKLTIEIPDDVVESVRQFCDAQIRTEIDPDLKTPVTVRVFANPRDFLRRTIAATLRTVVEQFPTPTLRAQLIARQNAQKAIEDGTQPTITDAVA